MNISTVKKISLFLLFFCTQAFAATNLGTFIDDVLITTTIKIKIMQDQSIPLFDIGVTTNNGDVILAGTVDSKTHADALGDIAKSVNGVKTVDISKLTVRPSKQAVKDTYITGKIKTLFITKKMFNGGDIAAISVHVETNNGSVYLSGEADNKEQIKNAIDLSKSVDGVRSVESRIKLLQKNETVKS